MEGDTDTDQKCAEVLNNSDGGRPDFGLEHPSNQGGKKLVFAVPFCVSLEQRMGGVGEWCGRRSGVVGGVVEGEGPRPNAEQLEHKGRAGTTP